MYVDVTPVEDRFGRFCPSPVATVSFTDVMGIASPPPCVYKWEDVSQSYQLISDEVRTIGHNFDLSSCYYIRNTSLLLPLTD